METVAAKEEQCHQLEEYMEQLASLLSETENELTEKAEAVRALEMKLKVGWYFIHSKIMLLCININWFIFGTQSINFSVKPYDFSIKISLFSEKNSFCNTPKDLSLCFQRRFAFNRLFLPLFYMFLHFLRSV